MTISLSSTDTELPANIPQGLARYSGRTEMARGGNGVLHAGYDRVTGRVVAIKSLLPEHRGDLDRRRRLLREARVTAQLQHPGVVPVYEINDDEELGVYYTMKRISGVNYFEVLKRIAQGDSKTLSDFPLKARVEVIVDVCQTLAYSHARGVIHRDLKPENMWVGNFGEVVLLDWGTAKVWGSRNQVETSKQSENQVTNPNAMPLEALSPGKSGSHQGDRFLNELSSLTPSHRLLGTPTYMSPEQIDEGPIDERSDIFSIGICLYEAIAIREPFRGSNREETFANIRFKSPTPPSERSPQYGIPQSLDSIIERAIQKQPAARYQSMRELILDIKNVEY